MVLKECSKGDVKKILGFGCGLDNSRMVALGFFIGEKIVVIKKKKSGMVIKISNTLYAIDNSISEGVVVEWMFCWLVIQIQVKQRCLIR